MWWDEVWVQIPNAFPKHFDTSVVAHLLKASTARASSFTGMQFAWQ